MELYKQQLIQIKDEAPGIRSFFFGIPDNLPAWEEGAHIHFAFPDFYEGEKPNRARVRHMSIASLASEKNIMISSRLYDESPFKRALGKLQIGDEMVFFKVATHLKLRRENRPVVLLSMGIGLAAFRPLALAYQANPEGISTFFSVNVCRQGTEVFKNEFEEHTGEFSHASWHNSRESYFSALASLPDDAIYYVVGSDEFVRTNLKRLLELNVAAEDIVIDKRPDLREFFFATLDQ